MRLLIALIVFVIVDSLSTTPSRLAMDISLVVSLIEERVKARSERNYSRADELKLQLESAPFFLEIIDHSYKNGGGSTWRARNVDTTILDILPALKRAALDTDSSMTGEQEDEFISQLMSKLQNDASRDPEARELQGRKPIDAAFELAMMGIKSNDVFNWLVEQQTMELSRWGPRVSVRALDLIRLVEKAACAGIPRDHGLYSLAGELIKNKPGGADSDTAASLLSAGAGFSLSSARPKMFLWKHLSRQRKAGRQQDEQAISTPSDDDAAIIDELHHFADPELPLIIDLGCGLGVSLLGLAENLQTTTNYLGIELNPQSVRFARGIAKRWGVDGCLRILCCDVETGLEAVTKNYAGPVALITVNFPTPFRRRTGNQQERDEEEEGEAEDGEVSEQSHCERTAGNSQLPDISEFMLSAPIATKIEHLLRRSGGSLLVQSQVEDVAVFSRELIESATSLRAPTDVGEWADVADETERQKRVLLACPTSARAEGYGWLRKSPLALCAASETEVQCDLEGKRVHRFILK